VSEADSLNIGIEPDADSTGPAAPPPTPSGLRPGGRSSWRKSLSFTNIGIVYVLILLIIIFSIAAPHTFPTWQTAKTILNQNAIAGLIALALVVPLSARTFDLSVGNAMGLCNVLVAWLLVNKGVAIIPAILLTVAAGLAIGLLNGLVVVVAKIDSFIGTLATGSLMAAAVSLISNDQSIIGNQLNGTFGKIATDSVGGIALPVILMLIVAAVLWFIQKYTVVGRRIYATGFNERGAQLAGIRTTRLIFMSLIVSGVVAAIAGVLLASQVSSGSPDIGPPYLLDAFAAAFLGATQFGGRFNAWGTVLAVILLGTGTTGLVLVGGAPWTQEMFSGLVLLVALGATNLERTLAARSWVTARRRGRGSASGSSGPARVLVVANQTAATPALASALAGRVRQSPARFHLLVPSATGADEEQTKRVLDAALPTLSKSAGNDVTGSIGESDPVAAIKDAISRDRYDEIIVSTLPLRASKWLKQDIVSKLRPLGLPVSHVETEVKEPTGV